jgi:hypothetical protein
MYLLRSGLFVNVFVKLKNLEKEAAQLMGELDAIDAANDIEKLKAKFVSLLASKSMKATSATQHNSRFFYTESSPAVIIARFDGLTGLPDEHSLKFSKGAITGYILFCQIALMLEGKFPIVPEACYFIAALGVLHDNLMDAKDDGGEKHKYALCDAISECIKFGYHDDTARSQIVEVYEDKLQFDFCWFFQQFLKSKKIHSNSKIKNTILLLNECQRESLRQLTSSTEPATLADDLFKISYMKGAATAELFARICLPDASEERLASYRKLGGLIQFFDDILDIQTDIDNGINTYAIKNYEVGEVNICTFISKISLLFEETLSDLRLQENTLSRYASKRFLAMNLIPLNKIQENILENVVNESSLKLASAC